jgi:hypothetical protein
VADDVDQDIDAAVDAFDLGDARIERTAIRDI